MRYRTPRFVLLASSAANCIPHDHRADLSAHHTEQQMRYDSLNATRDPTMLLWLPPATLASCCLSGSPSSQENLH